MFYHVRGLLGNYIMDEMPKTSISGPDSSSDAISPSPLSAPLSAPNAPIFSASSERKLHNMFLDPQGLRSGWRVVLYLLMAAAIVFLLGALSRQVHPVRQGSVRSEFIGELIVLAGAILPALIMAAIEKRPFDAYGLPRRSAFGKLFWMGVVWGFLFLSLLMLFMRGAGVFSISSLAIHGHRLVKFAAFWGVFFLAVAFFEEFIFRGYTQFTLTQGMGFWPAAFVLSFIFGAIHLGNQGEAWAGALAAGLIGLFFCLTLRRTGTLWFAVGFHASWDWAESYFYSVPDSGGISPGHLLNSSFHGPRWLTGGSVGPEGSALVFVVIVLFWVVFDRVYPQVKYQA